MAAAILVHDQHIIKLMQQPFRIVIVDGDVGDGMGGCWADPDQEGELLTGRRGIFYARRPAPMTPAPCPVRR